MPVVPPELLRPEDAFFTYLDGPQAPQHAIGVAVLAPGRPVELADLASRAEQVLAGRRRFSQLLERPAGGLARPAWVVRGSGGGWGRGFAVEEHVHEVQLLSPGGRDELGAALGAIASAPLDRAKPLWDLYLLGGLAGGRQAFVVKLHHALADGLGTIDVALAMFDQAQFDQAQFDQAQFDQARQPQPRGRRSLTARSLTAWSGPCAVALQVVDPVASLLRGAAELAGPGRRRHLKASGRVVEGLLDLAGAGRAPRSGIEDLVGPGRVVGVASAPASEVRRAREATGATLAELSVAAGLQAVSEVLPSNGLEVPPTLRLVVPVSTRPARQAALPGTWTASLAADFPSGQMSPRARLDAVRVVMRGLRRSSQPRASSWLMSFAGKALPPFAHRVFAALSYSPTWMSMLASVLEGPRQPQSLLGAPVEVAYPLVPPPPGVGLTIGAMSWAGEMAIGVVTGDGVVTGSRRVTGDAPAAGGRSIAAQLADRAATSISEMR
ncbi:MAG: wax ester/triacylglycerol synthase domain-containing protein [Acidimicrobiales bacterium]